MSIDLGLATNAMSEWKNGRIKPSIETLEKIADYFDVSTDYLLGRDVQAPAKSEQLQDDFKLTQDEKDLIEQFRKLSIQKKAKIVNAIFADEGDMDFLGKEEISRELA